MKTNHFPSTAPHASGKDKKLFSAARKDPKQTPKGASKKITKATLETPGAYKSANQAVYKKVGSEHINQMMKALKKPDLAITLPKSPKNKSFRTDKVSEYIKNNFFLKYNYQSPKEKNIPTRQDSSKPVNKNRTSDAVLRHLQKAQQSTADSKLDYDMLDEEDAGKLNIEDLIFVEKRLHVISLILENDMEIYDQVKEYVDIVQEENFSQFFMLLKNSRMRVAVKNSMILERWVMFFIFYFYFNQESAKQIGVLLAELVRMIHKNILVYLGLFAHWTRQYDNLEVVANLTSQPTKA